MSYEACDACQEDVTNEPRVYLCLPCAGKTYIPVLACEHHGGEIVELQGGVSWCRDCGALMTDGAWHRPGRNSAAVRPPLVFSAAHAREREDLRELLRRATGIITDAQGALAAAPLLLDEIARLK